MSNLIVEVYSDALDLLDAAPPGDDGVANIDTLIAHVEVTKFTKVRVVPDPDLDPRDARAYIVRENGSATIVVARELNHCWKRFVQLKELIHLVVDTEADYVRDLPALLVSMNLPAGVTAAMLSRAQRSEVKAMMIALAYAMPPGHRPASLAGTTAYDVAKRFQIPEVFVETFYGTMAEEFNVLDKLRRS